MTKYFKLLMVALFATLSFTLTSCGDDDEPNGNGAKGELTINGKKYVFDIFMGGVEVGPSEDNDYSCSLWNKDTDDYSLIISIGGWDNVSSGTIWDVNNYEDDYFESYIDFTWTTSTAQIGTGPISGSVKVTKVDTKSNKITLSFNNTEFECYRYNTTITVNGTITLPIDGTWGI